MDSKRKRSLSAARCGNHAQTVSSPESSWISGVPPTQNSCPESTSSSTPLLHSFIQVNRLHIRAQFPSLKFRWNNRFIRESSPTMRENPSPTSFLALRVLFACHLPDPVQRVPATCSVNAVDVVSNPWTTHMASRRCLRPRKDRRRKYHNKKVIENCVVLCPDIKYGH